MEAILEQLRALGVHLPADSSEEQLLRLSRLANPWSVSTGMSPDGCYATTRKKQLTGEESASTSYGRTPAEAACKLLLKQLQAGAYPTTTTAYKTDAMAYRKLNP